MIQTKLDESTSIKKTIKTCRICGIELTEHTWGSSAKQWNNHRCKACDVARVMRWQKENPVKHRLIQAQSRIKKGHTPMNKNKSCTQFLGIHVAEQVLAKVFRDVKRMPNNNPGFDFFCSHGKKIDVKSSTMYTANKKNPRWHFHIKHNKMADHFLCIAFDNRESLTPLHLWLLPDEFVNDRSTVSVSTTTIDKWNKYRINIDKIVKCCDAIR